MKALSPARTQRLNRSALLLGGSLLLLLLSAAKAKATTTDDGYLVAPTSYGWNQMPASINQSSYGISEVIQFYSNGVHAFTSDYAVADWVAITSPQNGEQWAWQAIKPDGTAWTLATLTYGSGNPGCFTWNDGTYECGSGAFNAWAGPGACNEPGNWTLNVLDEGTQAATHGFSTSHAASSPDLPYPNLLGISSPLDTSEPLLNPSEIALIDLAADQNYTATDATCPAPVSAQGMPTAVCFSASTSTSNSINWTTTLTYATSGGLGSISDPPRNFSTTSGGAQNEQYVSEGGQVQATATTTASDGSTVQDCVTSYIEGPAVVNGQGGIPNGSITSQLETLYPETYSYNKYLNDGTATTNLMTGVAYRESTYTQFRTPAECNYDLWSLKATWGILAKWPYESETKDANGNCVSDGGKHIGLMQVPTTSVDAWKWADTSLTASANTNDGVNVFGGQYQSVDTVHSYENYIINGVPKTKNQAAIPGHWQLGSQDGLYRENMGLVQYGGYLKSACASSPPTQACLNSQYYIPSCSGTQGTITQKGETYLTCSTGWQWVPNTANQLAGLRYVSNWPTDPWYDGNPNNTGVRQDLQ